MAITQNLKLRHSSGADVVCHIYTSQVGSIKMYFWDGNRVIFHQGLIYRVDPLTELDFTVQIYVVLASPENVAKGELLLNRKEIAYAITKIK